jgi:hypothetical protein
MSSSYNYSYNVLINRFEAFAAGHLLIKRFTHGQIDLSDTLQDDQYPFMHVTPDTVEPVQGAMQFGFHIMFADIPRDKETKAEYQREVISDCIRLGQDLIAEIQNGLTLFGFDVQLVGNPVFEPFMEEQKNTVTGVAFTIKLEVPWDWSACDIPAVWSVGGSSTGGSGTPVGILLQVNNVDNAVQSQLDLVAGDNITLTDNGDGSVTIDASGGGGGAFYAALEFDTNHTTAQGNPYLIGDTVWYAGNVYRCIANNDAIVPTNVSYWTLVGAGFRVRQNIIDWNATTGDYQIINKPTIPSPQGLQDVITVNSNLNVNNNIKGNGTDLTFIGNKNLEILPTAFFRAALGKYPPSYSELYIEPIYAQLMSQGATIQKIKVDTTNVYVQTPAVAAATATVGQVLTLTNATTGAVEYQTPSAGIKHGTTSGTDTYTVSITGVTSYVDGDAYLIRFPNANTTGCTLNINSLGAKTLWRNNDGELIGGDIWAGAEMLCIYNSTLNVFQCIGTSPNSLFAYVTNAEASTTMTKGQPVYAFGGTGDRLTVKLAYNTTDATSAQTVGMVVSTSIAPNQKGIIIVAGQLDNLNTLPTSTFADGDAIYLGATAGSITKVKPVAPNHLVYLGFVTTASPGNAGRMYVRVQNGYEMSELHDVQSSGAVNNDILYRDTAVNLWKPASIPTILGYTPVTNARTISTTSPLSGGGDLSANRTLSIADAAADGTTKGAAAFTASDFNSSSGVISLDYTNAQKATAAQPGFLTAADWSTFNGKQNNIGLTTVGNNIATLANPSAISYIRINADNTVTTRTPSQVLSDLGISNPQSSVSLTSDVNLTAVNTNLADITGLSFAITAGSSYRFRAELQVLTTVSGTGMKFAANANVAVSSVVYRAISVGGTSGAQIFWNASTLDSATTSTLSTVTNQFVTIEGLIVANNNGTVVMRFGKMLAVAGTLTVKAGSILMYQTV